MKIIITLDPAVVACYSLLTRTETLKARLNIAAENVLKKMDEDCSVHGRLLFNRPGAISVDIQ